MKKRQHLKEKKENLDYEKDPRFISYIKELVALSKNKKRLIDGHKVSQKIRKEFGII